jgi:hypothetical protein
MQLKRTKKNLTEISIFQASGYLHKPVNAIGLRSGCYFLSLEACKFMEAKMSIPLPIPKDKQIKARNVEPNQTLGWATSPPMSEQGPTIYIPHQPIQEVVWANPVSHVQVPVVMYAPTFIPQHQLSLWSQDSTVFQQTQTQTYQYHSEQKFQ